MTPTPMPALVPLLRPVFAAWALVGFDVPVAVAAAAFGSRDVEDVVEVEVVVGVDGDGDAVDVATGVDHVVAERSDLRLILRVSIYRSVKRFGLFCSGGGRSTEEDILVVDEEISAIGAVGGAHERPVCLIEV